MGLKQEPIVFNFKPEGSDIVSSLSRLPQVTLLINPESLQLAWKKVITKVRTKSRIVSLYWGQEPLSFTYRGQTGNLYPSAELRDRYATDIAKSSQGNVEFLLKRNDELVKLISDSSLRRSGLAQAYGSEDSRVKAEEELLQDYSAELDSNSMAIEQFGNNIIDASNFVGETTAIENIGGGLSHTDLLEISPKYQKFKQLQGLYEASQIISDLMKVKYRHYIFEGFFESFSFTDDAKNPYNWQYSLSFTVLNWDETVGGGIGETMLISDEKDQSAVDKFKKEEADAAAVLKERQEESRRFRSQFFE